MGRNAETRQSLFLIRLSHAGAVLDALDFVADEKKSPQDNLKDCLADHFFVFNKRDRRSRLLFEIDDSASDADYDLEVLDRLAPYLEKGSFYESEGDGIYLMEIVDGGIRHSNFNVEYDEDSGDELNRRLLSSDLVTFADQLSVVDTARPRTAAGTDPLQVDPTHWPVKDKSWMRKREAQWNEAERSLCREKTRKAQNIIKQYFLKGKLPDWRKLDDGWDIHDKFRHLDLFSLLYCHPVQDYQVLKPLRDAYLQGKPFGRTHADVRASSETFRLLAETDPASNGGLLGKRKHFDREVALLTRLMCEQLAGETDRETGAYWLLSSGPGLFTLAAVEKWLQWDQLNEYGEKFLLQFPEAREVMYDNVCNVSDRRNRNATLGESNAALLEKVFYAMRDFVLDKEGDAVRSRVVNDLFDMFNERPWIPRFKEIWERVRDDEDHGRGLETDPSKDPLKLDLAYWESESVRPEARENAWKVSEARLRLVKSGDGLAVCRPYFFSGELPIWSDWHPRWDSGSHWKGHLDFFSFLYLHPSNDYKVLKPLADGYLAGRWFGRRGYDLRVGKDLFLLLGVECPAVNGKRPYGKKKGRVLFHLGDQAETLTRIFFETMEQEFDKDDIRQEFHATTHRDFKWISDTDYRRLFVILSQWLCRDEINEAGESMIFQFDIALDHLCEKLAESVSDYDVYSYREAFEKVAYRYLYFDCDAEGDTARSRVARGFRERIDKYSWAERLQKIWDGVRSGAIEVANPWQD